MTQVLVLGLVSTYLWVFASQLHTPGFGWLQHWLRTGWLKPLVSCPWCFGWWASLIGAALLLGFTWWTLAVAVASAAVTGILGAYFTPGISED